MSDFWFIFVENFNEQGETSSGFVKSVSDRDFQKRINDVTVRFKTNESSDVE